MSARNRLYLPALTLSLLGSLAAGQSGQYQAQNVNPDQPGEMRVFGGGQMPTQGLPPMSADGRFWPNRAPASVLSIGVYVSPVPPVMSSQLRLRKGTGLVVEGVVPGSPAEHAGIQRYDVIERMNNRQVASVPQVEQMLRGNKPGDRVPFLIIREGDRQNIEVPIEGGAQWQRQPDNSSNISPPRYLPDGFRFSPDQTRELQQMSEQLRKEVEQQERQIERMKDNLRRQADQARRELEQLKDQIRNELEQQKRQMLDQLKSKPDSEKRDESRQENRF